MEEAVTSFLLLLLLFSFCPRAGFALLSFSVSGVEDGLLEKAVPFSICLGVKTRYALGKIGGRENVRARVLCCWKY